MLKTDLSQFNNSWYKPGNQVLIALWFMVNSLVLNTYFPWPVWFKQLILRIFGAKIGKKVMIKPMVNIKYPWYLTIGDNTWIGEQVWIDNLIAVTIGSNVCISQGAMLLTGNHDYSSVSFDLQTKSIILEEGVWIGAKSIVCPGVTCASHSVLSVNSVATKNLLAYHIYQGNPAKIVRERTIHETKKEA